jgi:ABC-2 type transport system permease protein
MPGWLQAATYAIPARYFVSALKALFLKGAGLSVLWLDAALLAAFAVAVTALALGTFRKALD